MAVDEAAGEDLFLGRPAFAFEEAARDASAGGGVPLVVDGQGHEVAEDSAILVAGCGDHDRIAVTDHAGTIGLTGNRTCLERQRSAADLKLFLIRHGFPSMHEATHRLMLLI